MASFVIRALDLVVSRPSWELAVALIETCQVDGIFQAHDLSASLELKNGTVTTPRSRTSTSCST